jgi:hypothetical protein
MTNLFTHASDDFMKLNPELRGSVDSTPTPASKYHNVKTEACGLKFDSGKEAAHCATLILLEKQYEIFCLQFQVRFPLPGGIIYIADAVYLDKQLWPHVVDCKGFKTKEYKMKRRLFRETYGRNIEEV